jgi:hypothetical protein
MEKKKTSPFVYVMLIAVIVALGVFIFRRLQQNAEDRRAIDKIYPRAQ